jgi:hypothetical protein
MTRDDPLILPICQVCRKYKGIGPCKNPGCSESDSSSGESALSKQSPEAECSLCENEALVSCVRCARKFCLTHSKEEVESQLTRRDQRVGTCSICNQLVCEHCWILEGNGAITCIVHNEGSHLHDK